MCNQKVRLSSLIKSVVCWDLLHAGQTEDRMVWWAQTEVSGPETPAELTAVYQLWWKHLTTQCVSYFGMLLIRLHPPVPAAQLVFAERETEAVRLPAEDLLWACAAQWGVVSIISSWQNHVQNKFTVLWMCSDLWSAVFYSSLFLFCVCTMFTPLFFLTLSQCEAVQWDYVQTQQTSRCF